MTIQDEILSRSVWLTGFWGFDVGSDGAYGFTKEVDRDRFEKNAEDPQLVAIYGASSKETPSYLRAQLLGLIEIELKQIDGHSRMSLAAKQERIDRGREDKWRFAYPVRRAWKIPNGMSVGQIFESYDPSKGQHIAAFGTYLTRSDKRNLSRISLTEVSVFGEPPLGESDQVYSPSNRFPKSSGEREANYNDGRTWLYVFRNKHFSKDMKNGQQVFKVGVSNDLAYRQKSLNSGFPPELDAGWSNFLSEPFENAEAAEQAEDALKRALQEFSMGGEFFRCDTTSIELKFAEVSKANTKIIHGVTR